MGFLCNLILSFGLSGHPAHGLGFKPHQIRSAFHHKFIINSSVFIGGVGAAITHLCFERRRIGHYIKGSYRVVHGAAVISGTVVLIPGRSAGADRQFGLCRFVLYQISVRNIGVVPVQSVADLARNINQEGELFGCKNFLCLLVFLYIFQHHISFIGHGKGNIFIFRYLQSWVDPFVLCIFGIRIQIRNAELDFIAVLILLRRYRCFFQQIITLVHIAHRIRQSDFYIIFG